MRQPVSSAAMGKQLQPVIASLQHAMGDHLVALVLFGSRARNDARPDSDWDLLLIADNLPPHVFSRHAAIKHLIPVDWRGRVAVVAKTPAEFESYLPALVLDIAVDGLVLHDTDGYMAKRLAYVRRLLTEQGLYREQRGAEFIWRWQTFPGYNWNLTWQWAA